MDAADYWQMVREYSIWNTAIASLQFWTADLDPVTLGRSTEEVYTKCECRFLILFGVWSNQVQNLKNRIKFLF